MTRLYSRTGEDISESFPDLAEALRLPGAIDGELLILRDGRVQSFNVLQQRLNRKTVTPSCSPNFPRICAPMICWSTATKTCATCRSPSAARGWKPSSTSSIDPRVDLSPLVPFATWDELTAARADPATAGAGADADAVEGVMLKRRDAAYVPGRPKGLWWKWKRDPLIVDAVLMYAQRGHGKRSSYYSDYTFGVWTTGESGDELVPVGKAYFGFTDEELHRDRPLRAQQHHRAFRPGARGDARADKGLVFEVAFEGLQRSTRHKSGLAMRFPRISRLRWDKPPREADRLETLEKMLERIESGRGRTVFAVHRRCTRADASRSCWTLQVRRCRMADNVNRFLGGPPLAVLGPAHSAVDPDRRGAVGARPRPVEHRAQPAQPDPQRLGHGLRRRPLALAYFLLGAVIVIPIWLILRLGARAEEDTI